MFQLSAALASCGNDLSSLQSDLTALAAEPADDDLAAELSELERAVPALEKRVEKLRSGVDAVSPSEVSQLQQRFNFCVTEWKKRKRGCREIIGQIAETAAKSWKEKKFCVTRQRIYLDASQLLTLTDTCTAISSSRVCFV
jgi:hypothetical protein